MLARFHGQHVVLLQGPAGPFFRQVAAALEARGARCCKINLNPGDTVFFTGPNATAFQGRAEEWPDFLARFLVEQQIDVVMVFGDCRPYHRVAREVAKRLGRRYFVFEEGYVRPDYITLEEGGVNGNSSLPRDPEFYRQQRPPALPRAVPVGNTFWPAATRAFGHALACTLLWWLFPHYRHHRDVNVFRQTPYWWRSYWRKRAKRGADRVIEAAVTGSLRGRYFIVPLQVELDSQLTHSPFSSIREFIEVVVRSFVTHAPPETVLLFKHHPFDRPYHDYTDLLQALGAETGLGERLLYADTIHLPTALDNARGAVVINSTVGLSAVLHGTPTQCLGRAIYDLPGLTHQGTLDDFWRAPGVVERALARRFRDYVIAATQINGSVWTGAACWDRPENEAQR